MSEHTYKGGELELFARARNWKAYWISALRNHIHGSVLEVGAGIGANTLLLRNGAENRWVCLEPDPQLAAVLEQKTDTSTNLPAVEVRQGTVASLGPGEIFDTILYIDVLEHIEEDRQEVEQASNHLAAGGHLIVLSPAYTWLFSPFDQALGHYRRYTAGKLKELTPPALRVTKAIYLDSIGLLASAANRFFLKQSLPNPRQIYWWDTCLVRCSRILDPLTAYRFGKSVACIWERVPSQPAG
jgi:SAM-dependent methyltransferase